MSYQQHGKIEAADINTTLAGAASGSAASTTLNAIWGAGSGDRGYGQTPYITNVAQHSKVTATAFASIVTTTDTISKHQNTTLANSAVPSQNQLIEYASGVLQTNINTVNTNRLNAKLQGPSVTTTAINNIIWSDSLTFTFKVAFPTANEARYFFNCGGQLALTFFHPTGSTGTNSTGAVNNLLNQLCTASGTIVMSAMNTGTATILSTSFKGISRIGGSGSPAILDENKGYYGLTTSYQPIFKQLASAVVPGYYSDSYLQVSARTNGSIGSNGDNGDSIFIQVMLDQIPNSASVKAGTTVNLIAIPPAQAGEVAGAHLPVKSWAMPVVTHTTAAIGAPTANPSTPGTNQITPTTPSVWNINIQAEPAVLFPEIRAGGTVTFRVSGLGWDGTKTVGMPPGTVFRWSLGSEAGFNLSDAVATSGTVTIGNNTLPNGPYQFHYGEFTVSMKNSTTSPDGSIIRVNMEGTTNNVVGGFLETIRFKTN